MYAYNGTLIIKKGFFTFEEFMEEYQEAQTKHKDKSPFGIHFRVATHGTISKENCHPFRVNKKVAIMHNGILPMNSDIKDELSDTQHFVNRVLKQLPNNFMNNDGSTFLIEHFMKQSASKLLALHANKSVRIYRESKGAWVEGCWYSNPSCEKKVVTYVPKETTWWATRKPTKGYTGTYGTANNKTKLTKPAPTSQPTTTPYKKQNLPAPLQVDRCHICYGSKKATGHRVFQDHDICTLCADYLEELQEESLCAPTHRDYGGSLSIQ
jgi:hypothetical protein